MKSGQYALADIIAADLKGLLTRLAGLETLAFSDGAPFADEVTLIWIRQHVLDTANGGMKHLQRKWQDRMMTFSHWSRKRSHWWIEKARMPH